MEAGLRETHEEVNLSPEDLIVYPQYHKQLSQKMKRKDKFKTVDFYLAKLKNPLQVITLSDELSAYRWLPKDEITSVSNNSDYIEMFNEFDPIVRKL